MPKEWWEDPYEPPEYSYENNGSPDADNDDDRDED